jgi:DNA topoisomerase-1
MHDGTHVLAGECTAIAHGSREREHRGDLLTIVKPDNTVLVHDADGYQPVAWLTRASSVTVEDGALTASDDGDVLRVVTHDEHGHGRYPASAAGVPLGPCPDCDGTLVRTGSAVECLGCEARYGLPSDATVRETRCGCGLPTMRVERGSAFEVCVDRDCDSLDEQVREAFDARWSCPACEGDLRVIRRGGLLLGCVNYPECDTGFTFPTGLLDGTCGCGLPVFDTSGGRRCLDSRCERT